MQPSDPMLLLLAALAQSVPYLYNLSTGTRLTVERPIRIRAHEIQEPIGSVTAANLRCYVVAKHTESFDRVIPAGTPLPVIDVERRALSTRGLLYGWTYVYVGSDALDCVTCVAGRNAPEPTISDFRATVAGVLKVTLPSAPVEVR